MRPLISGTPTAFFFHPFACVLSAHVPTIACTSLINFVVNIIISGWFKYARSRDDDKSFWHNTRLVKLMSLTTVAAKIIVYAGF